MTIYEILAIITPITSTVIGGLVVFVITKIGSIDSRLSDFEKEVYFIKGMLSIGADKNRQ